MTHCRHITLKIHALLHETGPSLPLFAAHLPRMVHPAATDEEVEDRRPPKFQAATKDTRQTLVIDWKVPLQSIQRSTGLAIKHKKWQPPRIKSPKSSRHWGSSV